MANTWFAFHGYNNNQAVNVSIFDMLELDSIGMHGYPTQADANAKPNDVNIFQAPAVNAAINDANNARDVGSLPGKAVNAGANAAGKAVKNALGNGTSLVFGNTSGLLGRIVKVSLGTILIIAGVMRMSGAKQDLIQVAGAAAKGAVK